MNLWGDASIQSVAEFIPELQKLKTKQTQSSEQIRDSQWAKAMGDMEIHEVTCI